MPKLDLHAIEQTNRSSYPEPFATSVAKRLYRRLAPAGGLTDFGVSHVTLKPGGLSSQRHWHEGEDEFVVILAGEAVLIEDEGEILMKAGDCAAFPKGVADGHHLVNRSDEDCVFLAVGGPGTSDCHYSDVDLHWEAANSRFVHRDGRPY